MRSEKDRRLSALEKREPKALPVIVRMLVAPSPDGPITTGAIRRSDGAHLDRLPNESIEELKRRALA